MKLALMDVVRVQSNNYQKVESLKETLGAQRSLFLVKNIEGIFLTMNGLLFLFIPRH